MQSYSFFVRSDSRRLRYRATNTMTLLGRMVKRSSTARREGCYSSQVSAASSQYMEAGRRGRVISSSSHQALEAT